MNLVEKFIEKQIARYGEWLLTLAIIFSIIILVFLARLTKDIFCPYLGKFQICHLIASNELIVLATILVATLFVVFTLFLSWLLDVLLRKPLLYFRGKDIICLPAITRWIYQGSLVINNGKLEISTSNSGCLINGFYFKNFIVNFKLDIINGGGIGIIFRAQDLENYLMLQIGIRDPKDCDNPKELYPNHIVVTPHIRFLGNFETFNIEKREPYFATKLVLKTSPKCHNHNDDIPIDHHELSVWLKAEDNLATIKINSEIFCWNIPSFVEPNIIQRPKGESSGVPEKMTASLWFRRRRGKIGFRAYGLEKAVISDLDIEALQWFK